MQAGPCLYTIVYVYFTAHLPLILITVKEVDTVQLYLQHLIRSTNCSTNIAASLPRWCEKEALILTEGLENDVIHIVEVVYIVV